MSVELIPNTSWSWHSTVAPAKVEGLLTVMEDVDEVLAVLLAKWAMGGVLLSHIWRWELCGKMSQVIALRANLRRWAFRALAGIEAASGEATMTVGSWRRMGLPIFKPSSSLHLPCDCSGVCLPGKAGIFLHHLLDEQSSSELLIFSHHFFFLEVL